MLYQLSYSRLIWLRRMELNHLSSGYEPDEIPFLYSAITLPGEPGFEPGQTESKSGVLPLDDSPISLERAILYSFLSFFQVKMKKKQKKIKIWFHLPFQKTRKKNLKKIPAYWKPIYWNSRIKQSNEWYTIY